MASKKAASKGKRYTSEEKQEIVSFVNQYNAEKGRGGVTAAVNKFGATALTISKWVKSGPKAAKKPGRKPAGSKVAGSNVAGSKAAGSKAAVSKAAGSKATKSESISEGKRSKVLGELCKLDQLIADKRKELTVLESRFGALKSGL